ncbi:multi-sensor signal transduction histidine kinase [Calothrix sp. NIES-4071]|nr:multi-sensor signal transduction histidine kinase [Calothrix sp. NIES-4071]BAZ56179.1 multi-sensor signal transduction histidine kinase [Calothrix sp. NIES-4105]
MRFYPQLLSYGVAIGSTAIALMLSLSLEPLISRTIGAFFYIAILVSTWYGGFRSGIVTIVLSTLAIDYFFIPPRYHLFPSEPQDILRLAVFLLVGLIINLLTSNFLKSKQKIKKLCQQLAQENAEQLRMALSAAQMGIWNWNMVTGEIKWSPEHEQLFGLAVGSFDGRYETFAACVHPEDNSLVNQVLQQALQTKGAYHCEFRVVWGDSSIHWVEGRGHAFYNEAGQPVRMTGTIMAVDERKQAQRELQQQFQQQRLVMEMTQRIRQPLNLQEILQTTVDEVRQFLGCDRVTIFKFFPGWGGTTVVESVTSEWMPILPLQIYDPCIGEENVEPFKRGLVTAKADIYNAGISPCHVEFLSSLQVRANLVVPILVKDKLWGLLAAHHCAAPREWQSREIDLLQQLGAQVSIAIQQAALFEQLQTQLTERQQAEQTLAKELLRIQTLFNTSFDGIVILNLQGNVIDANLRFAQMLGYTHKETAKLNIIDWDAQFTPSELQQLMHDYINFKTGVLETYHRRKDGSIYNVEISISIVEWEGEILRFCVCRDITERKQAQIALQQLNAELEQRVVERTAQLTQANDRLLETVIEQQQTQLVLLEQAQLLDLAHDTIITRDISGVISFWNEGAEHMYGWKKAEAIGQISNILLQSQFPQPLTEIEAELFEKGYWEGEIIHLSRDAQPLTVASRWVLQRDNAGKPIKVLEINNDITERKRIEDALRQSEEKFRQLAENIQAVFWMTDIYNQQVLYVSPAYESIWQRSCESIYQNFSNWLDAIHPADRLSVETAFMEQVRTGQSDTKYRIIRPDGSMRWIRDRAFPIKNELGEVVRVAGIAEDITEQQKIELLKSEFISIVSHELRTPLTAIRAALGLLNTGIYDKKPDKFKRMIEIAAIDSDRLVRLVNDILDLERLESGRAVLKKTTCNANDLIKQAVEGVQVIAKQQNITFNIHPTDAEVCVAPDAIIQNMINLLGNAIKFSPSDSTITLIVEQQTDHVLFQVTDQGRGIPTDKLEAIFGRFQQVDASDSRAKGGTGLGLAICRSIIEQHGGKIWAESTIDVGSTFFFTLPTNKATIEY